LIGSVADAYNNSTAESPGGEAIFEYAEGSYNTGRRHSALGNVSPREYEEAKSREGAVAQRQTIRGKWCKPTTLQIVVPSQIVS
jgi:hypothetical protein